MIKEPKTMFRVWHERGGSHMVFANNEEEAVEAFYESIASIIGHHQKICGCFGKPKLLDREKIVRIVKIEGPLK